MIKFYAQTVEEGVQTLTKNYLRKIYTACGIKLQLLKLSSYFALFRAKFVVSDLLRYSFPEMQSLTFSFCSLPLENPRIIESPFI